MEGKTTNTGLAGYLGKFADSVKMGENFVVQSDEYSLTHYCRVKIGTGVGATYQDVAFGPAEMYVYPEGDQSKQPFFVGILDEKGFVIPCSKNEKGDFEIITPDQQIQVIPSADNIAKDKQLPQTIVKVNFLNQEPVFQSEEKIKSPNGNSFMESENHTLTYTNGNQPVGPIEYYVNSPSGKAELFGLLGMDGQLTPCTKTQDGNFEIEDENHQKQVVLSAKNLLKDNPQSYAVYRTDYFMGYPINQTMVEQQGQERQTMHQSLKEASASR